MHYKFLGMLDEKTVPTMHGRRAAAETIVHKSIVFAREFTMVVRNLVFALLLGCLSAAVPSCDESLFTNSTCEPYGAYHKVKAKNGCDCQAQCDTDKSCDHWVYAPKQDGLCHFKNVPVNASDLKPGTCTVGPNNRGPTPAPAPTPGPQPAPPGAKNVLYIIVDDLRNELGFTNKNPHIITPNLDALAAAGTVFDRAYVQQGVCSPS